MSLEDRLASLLRRRGLRLGACAVATADQAAGASGNSLKDMGVLPRKE